MAHGHEGKLDAPAVEERPHEENVYPFMRERYKGLVDLVARTGLADMHLLPQGGGSRPHLVHHRLGAT